MSDWIIRDCRLEEVEAVLELWRQADAIPSTTDNAADLRRAIAESPAHVLVAEVQGTVIGSIIGTFDGWRGNIYRLAVHPAYRRRGLARALAAEVEERLVNEGAKRVTALVAKDHSAATSYWNAVGYVPDGRIVRYVRTLGTVEPASQRRAVEGGRENSCPPCGPLATSPYFLNASPWEASACCA